MQLPISRRDLLCRLGGGFAALGLSSVLAVAGSHPRNRAAEHGLAGGE
jgi:hypothetical protein